MKKAIFILLILVTSGLLYFKLTQIGKSGIKYKILKIENNIFRVEIADTDAKKTLGLSKRNNIEKDTGMLFVFESANLYGFWMKDMNFPLDFIWIKSNKVVDYIENAPPAKSNSVNIPIYSSKVPFDMALEVNSGTISEKRIKIGDNVIIQQ